MPNIVLDTSTLINFIDFSYRFDYSAIEKSPHLFERMFPVLEIVENAIEAFILYDDVYVDESSLKNTIFIEDYIRLEKIENCHLLKLNGEQTESIYRKIFGKLNIDKEQIGKILSMTETEHRMFMDAHSNFSLHGVKYFYPDIYPYGYYGKFLEEFKKGLSQTDRKFKFCIGGTDANLSFYHIIRYLYYLELQQMLSSELVLHPNRCYLSRFFSEYKRIYTNKIIEQYEPLRMNLYKRECKFMDEGDNSLLIPMVASYVLNRCKQREDLFKIINEVRNSKEAQLFRKGLSELVKIVEQKKNGEIDEILTSLEEARLKWDENLNSHPTMRKKCISLSIPVVSGIGMNIDIPYSMGNKTAFNLLTFIHKMLLNKS